MTYKTQPALNQTWRPWQWVIHCRNIVIVTEVVAKIRSCYGRVARENNRGSITLKSWCRSRAMFPTGSNLSPDPLASWPRSFACYCDFNVRFNHLSRKYPPPPNYSRSVEHMPPYTAGPGMSLGKLATHLEAGHTSYLLCAIHISTTRGRILSKKLLL